MKNFLQIILVSISLYSFMNVFAFTVEMLDRYYLPELNSDPLVADMLILNSKLGEEAFENMIQRAQVCTSELCIKTKPYLFFADLIRTRNINGCNVEILYYYNNNRTLDKIRFNNEDDCIKVNSNNTYLNPLRSSDGTDEIGLGWHKEESIFELHRVIADKFITKVSFNGKFYKFVN